MRKQYAYRFPADAVYKLDYYQPVQGILVFAVNHAFLTPAAQIVHRRRPADIIIHVPCVNPAAGKTVRQ